MNGNKFATGEIVRKPVEVVKGRILVGWAQKSPEPYYNYCSMCWSGGSWTHTNSTLTRKLVWPMLTISPTLTVLFSVTTGSPHSLLSESSLFTKLDPSRAPMIGGVYRRAGWTRSKGWECWSGGGASHWPLDRHPLSQSRPVINGAFNERNSESKRRTKVKLAGPCHGGTANGGCVVVGKPHPSHSFTAFHLTVYETLLDLGQLPK